MSGMIDVAKAFSPDDLLQQMFMGDVKKLYSRYCTPLKKINTFSQKVGLPVGSVTFQNKCQQLINIKVQMLIIAIYLSQ